MPIIDSLGWYRFANGDFSHAIRICRLAPELVTAIGANDDRLYLHPSYAPKMIHKHGLNAEHLPLLSLTAEFGTVIQQKAGTLSIFYDDQVRFRRMFHMAIKTTGERHEIWVMTFHRIDRSDYLRRLKKATILRRQA